jgi:hypothetical protein
MCPVDNHILVCYNRGMMKEQLPYLKSTVWEVLILGLSYRVEVPQRSKAVTLALNSFLEENPELGLSLSVLRTKVRTRFISSEELLLERALHD